MSEISRRKLAFGAGLALLTGTAGMVRAQPGAGPGPGPGPGMGRPGMNGGPGMHRGPWTTPEYLDGLKARLGITTAQEPAWKEYADTVNAVAEQMRAAHETVYEAMGTADWEERRNMMNNMFASREQARTTVQEAAQKLLPALDPAQRAQAQGLLPGLAGGQRMGMGMGGGMRNGMGMQHRP